MSDGPDADDGDWAQCNGFLSVNQSVVKPNTQLKPQLLILIYIRIIFLLWKDWKMDRKNMDNTDIVISCPHPPSQDICELFNSDFYHFKMYFWKNWGLIEKLLSESFDSQSKYFNFWVRNANWKYWFGFYHHQTYLSICRNPILTSETVIHIKKVYDIKTLYLPLIIMMILWWCRKDIRYHDFKVYGLLFWKMAKRKVVLFWNIVPRAGPCE